MAATLDIKIFRPSGGNQMGLGYNMTIRPVITVTTTGATHCDNSSLTVTYSGPHFSGSNNTTVTVGQNTTAQIYAKNKESVYDKNSMAGTVTVTVKLATSSGTVTKSKAVSYRSPFDTDFDEYPYADWEFTDRITGSSLSPYLGTSVVLTSFNNKGYGYKWRFRYRIGDDSSQYSEPVQETGTVCSIPIETYAPQYFVNKTSTSISYFYEWINVDGSVALTGINYNVSIYLPESVRPTITSVIPSDTEGYRATYGVYVGTKSILQASVDASGIYGSTITKVVHEIDGLSVNTTDPTITKIIGRLNQTGSRTLKTTVTDSRGRTAVRNTAITVVSYVSPSLSFSADRWDMTDNEVDDGSDTVRLLVDGTIPSINNVAVSGTLLIEQRQKGATAWTTTGAYDVTGPSVTKQVLVASQSVDNRYEYQATLTDIFGTSILTSSSVGLATPVLEFHGSGKGAGIGIVAPETGLNIGMQTDFRGTADDGYSRIRIANPEGTETIALAKLTGSDLELLAASSPVTDYDRAFVNSHVYMRNNLALGWLTSGNAQTTVLTMNRSNQVELNWTSSGLRGRVGKLLWSGTLSEGGSLTDPELPYYQVFAFLFQASNGTYVVTSYKVDQTIYAGCASYVGSVWMLMCGINITGTKLTLHYARAVPMNSPATQTGKTPLLRVYGLL